MDTVDHPSHYISHPSGIECIEIAKHKNFCLGCALKYLWRADLKGNAIEDLEKAKRYIQFEIDRRSNIEKLFKEGEIINGKENQETQKEEDQER